MVLKYKLYFNFSYFVSVLDNNSIEFSALSYLPVILDTHLFSSYKHKIRSYLFEVSSYTTASTSLWLYCVMFNLYDILHLSS